MHAIWTWGGPWLAHLAVGGSLVLLATLFWMRLVRQPARRQRLGELGLAAALLSTIAALGPAWISLPLGSSGQGPPSAEFQISDSSTQSPTVLTGSRAQGPPDHQRALYEFALLQQADQATKKSLDARAIGFKE